MRDINRYVIKKYAHDWRDIALELGFESYYIHSIKNKHTKDHDCFYTIIERWLQSYVDPTWKSLLM